MREIVKKIWRGEEPDWEHDVLAYRRDAKTVVMVVPHFKYKEKTLILAYPKPEHFPHFQQANKGTEQFGYANYFPGTIGSLELSSRMAGMITEWSNKNASMPRGSVKKDAPALHLDFAQAHFKTTQEDAQKPVLSRSIATYYGGWRLKALRVAFADAKKRGLPLVIRKKYSKSFRRWLVREKNSRFRTELVKAADEEGLVLRENRHVIVLVPKSG